MRHRELLAIREHRAEVEAAERAERERIEAPIKVAEKQLLDTHRRLITVQRENILKLKDPDIFVSPELRTARMSREDANKFNQAAVRDFIESTPEYVPYRTPENAQIILDYFSRSGVGIADAEMFRAAFIKLRDVGLLTVRETPAPLIEPIPEPAPEPEEQPGPKTYVGRDSETGLDREFTEREVDRMSSEEFKRAFRVAGTFTELFNAMRQQGENQ